MSNFCKGKFDREKGIMCIDLNCPICREIARNFGNWYK